mgnify:CR=1 FL=1
MCYRRVTLGVDMKILRAAAVGIAFAAGIGIAAAQAPPIPLMTGPQDPAQMQANFNRLINQINAILVPLLPANGAGLGVPIGSDGNGTITLPIGSASTAGIKIDPNGSGNIILFGDGDTGTLKFGNTTAFIKATGLAPCPGAVPNMPIGVGKTVTGYFIVQDWTGAKHGVASCRQTPNG